MRTTTPSGTRKGPLPPGWVSPPSLWSLALVGCGSATKTDEKKAETTSSKTESATSSATTTSEQAGEVRADQSRETTGTHRTIQDYIKENNIRDTVINRGDPGPTIDLPVPDGWGGQNRTSRGALRCDCLPASKVPSNPPRILAIFEKLTGNVDPEGDPGAGTR